MKKTIKQIKELAIATDNVYLLHLAKQLKKEYKKNIKSKILK